jgi:hypothetical protein
MAFQRIYDYDTMRREYLQGDTISVISKRHNANAASVSVYASRHGWTDLRRKAEQEVANAVKDIRGKGMPERAARWTYRAADAADRALEAWLALEPAKKRDEVRVDAQTVDKLIDAGRKAYGLDRDQGQTRITIGLYAGASGASVVPSGEPKQAQVIDIEARPAEASSASQAEAGVTEPQQTE